jgi:two-component system chemotaxis sensor kinase CheA
MWPKTCAILKSYLTFLSQAFRLAKEITEFSGPWCRPGCGKNAIDSIGGRVLVDSKKARHNVYVAFAYFHCRKRIALLFEVAGGFYAIPLMHTDSVVSLPKAKLHEVGDMLVADIMNETISIVYLDELLNSPEGIMDLGNKELLKGGTRTLL